MIRSSEIRLTAPSWTSRRKFTSGGQHLRTLDAETGGELVRFVYANGLLASIVDGDGNTASVEHAGGRASAIVAPGGQRTLLMGTVHLEGIATAPGETVYTPEGLMERMTDPRGNPTTFTWDELGLLERDEDAEGGAKNLTRAETANGHRVTITTELGRATTYTTEESPPADTTRRIVEPSGLQTTVLKTKKGITAALSSSGMIITSTEAPDPAWGMQAPFSRSATLQWLGGRTLTVDVEREAVLGVEGDPLSVLSRTDRITINGKTTLRVFDRKALTETITTPENRTLRRTMDDAGHGEHRGTGAAPAD